jgi:hypothetical protein
MKGYVFFYASKRIEVYATSLYEAQCKAIESFNPPKSKRHMVHGMLAEVNGSPVTHTGVEL